jgi:hypothetical protein
MFLHLKYVKQTYFEHLLDAISYSFMAFKASGYFFIHAYWPDIFEFNGSKQIEELNNIITDKRNKINKSK